MTATLQRKERIVPGNPNQIGIGDIIMSALDLDAFRRTHGDGGNPSSFVLCDGSAVDQSQYHQQTGESNVPNLMGRYVRGGDVDAAGRDLGVIPLPSASKAPGALLPQDTIAHAGHHHHFNHTHQFDPGQGGGWAEMGDAQGGGDNHVLRTGYGGSKGTGGPREGDTTDETVASLPAGIAGSEVRPISTILNFFIRIN